MEFTFNPTIADYYQSQRISGGRRVLNRWKRSAIVLVCLALLPATGYCKSPVKQAVSPSHPSAYYLVSAWRTYVHNLTTTIHSYRLEGFVTQILPVAKNQNPKLPRWTSLVDGKKYILTDLQPVGRMLASYNGSNWQYFLKTSLPHTKTDRQLMIETKSNKLGNSTTDFNVKQDPLCFPYTLFDAVSKCSGVYIGPSVYDIYTTRIAHIDVKEPMMEHGKQCYCLHLPLRYIPNNTNMIPNQVWLCRIGNNIVPWRESFRIKVGTTPHGGPLYEFFNLQLTAGSTYNNLWYPTALTEKMLVGSSVNESLAVSLKISHINEVFPVSSFNIPATPGTDITVNGVWKKVVPESSILLNRLMQTVIVAGLLVCLFTFFHVRTNMPSKNLVRQ